jgi:peptide deformylase
MHHKLIADMLDTMRDAPGVGLAATQVGVLERIFVWEVEDGHGAVINPRIVERSRTTVEADEACLSLPGLMYPVERPQEVRLEGIDANGDPVDMEAGDLLARVFQHETDHLDGTLFIDHLPSGLRREARRLLADQVLGLPPSPSARREATESSL